jgi:hypothetical protein
MKLLESDVEADDPDPAIAAVGPGDTVNDMAGAAGFRLEDRPVDCLDHLAMLGPCRYETTVASHMAALVEAGLGVPVFSFTA